ncbi:bifunctional folylpolyglutamate synthase/dihydrofolate synthase [Luteolibacter soli]|uniref:Dihydrofolate synthase/folylpolyglutamate synthase n=1 Tax=Luteolibacter soli TaxID=3135280 RepID=A0ABU9AXX0_9BACT
MTYSESIDWLFSTQMFGIKLGLEGPRRLLKEYLAFPAHGVKVIHVAGTNGKGSTCAMIDSVARAAGYRCGLFTSPHLIDYRERIRVSGVEIPEENCAAMLTELRAVCEALDPHPTFFEITLALAMRWFRERECEMIVLETGMGGRLDATTAVPADVCAITPVGLDHMQWLGDTVEAIAVEKAGIFVEGVPAISAPQEEGVRRVLEKEANERRCPLSFIDAPLQGYPVALPGPHQRWNAALALECLHAAGVHLDYGVVMHGLSTVRWPGRFERITYKGREVVLDGAHNPQGAAVLASTWKEEFGARKATLVFSAVGGKDIAGILELLVPLAEKIHICPVDTPRAVAAEELAAALPEGAPGYVCHGGFEAAFAAAMEGDGIVLVAGSLFLVGEAKAFLEGGTFQGSAQ